MNKKIDSTTATFAPALSSTNVAEVSAISKEMEEVYGCVRDLRMVVNILDGRLDDNLFPGITAEKFSGIASDRAFSNFKPKDFYLFLEIDRDMVAFLIFDAKERADKLDKLASDLSNKLVFFAGEMHRATASEGGVA